MKAIRKRQILICLQQIHANSLLRKFILELSVSFVLILMDFMFFPWGILELTENKA